METRKEKENEEPREIKGRPLFYNFWGNKFSKWSFIFLVVVFVFMVSLKMCDSPYVTEGDPSTIKIID
ncbi:MAG TPA: hypothetical protein VKZ56_06830 [Membranihabitans sp.]|nr:hypothetical protein [Membranihabitans sp.]